LLFGVIRFEKVEQKTLEYDEHGQPTFTTGNIGLMVALKPLKHAAKNPDPNADMVLLDEEETKEDSHANDQDTELPGGILVATVSNHPAGNVNYINACETMEKT
jgi:hypothetical protein